MILIALGFDALDGRQLSPAVPWALLVKLFHLHDCRVMLVLVLKGGAPASWELQVS